MIGFYVCKIHVERRVNLLYMDSLPEKLHGKGGSHKLYYRGEAINCECELY